MANDMTSKSLKSEVDDHWYDLKEYEIGGQWPLMTSKSSKSEVNCHWYDLKEVSLYVKKKAATMAAFKSAN